MAIHVELIISVLKQTEMSKLPARSLLDQRIALLYKKTSMQVNKPQNKLSRSNLHRIDATATTPAGWVSGDGGKPVKQPLCLHVRSGLSKDTPLVRRTCLVPARQAIPRVQRDRQ